MYSVVLRSPTYCPMSPGGNAVCWGTRCLSGTPAPCPPGHTAPPGGLTLGYCVEEGMSLLPAQRVQAGVVERGPRDALQALRWDAGTLSEGGTRGLWLTDEPDSILPQDLLWALQVDLTLVQEVFCLPPLPLQLEREGCRVGTELPACWAVPASRATLLPPSRTFPALHCLAFGFRGSTGFATDAGVPLCWQGPLWDPGGEDSLEQSLLQEGAYSCGTQPCVLPAGHGAGLSRCGSQQRWGSAHQALADLPWFPRQGQLSQFLPLQEAASEAEGILGGLGRRRDATIIPGGTAPCVLPLSRARSLSWDCNLLLSVASGCCGAVALSQGLQGPISYGRDCAEGAGWERDPPPSSSGRQEEKGSSGRGEALAGPRASAS